MPRCSVPLCCCLLLQHVTAVSRRCCLCGCSKNRGGSHQLLQCVLWRLLSLLLVKCCRLPFVGPCFLLSLKLSKLSINVFLSIPISPVVRLPVIRRPRQDISTSLASHRSPTPDYSLTRHYYLSVIVLLSCCLFVPRITHPSSSYSAVLLAFRRSLPDLYGCCCFQTRVAFCLSSLFLMSLRPPLDSYSPSAAFLALPTRTIVDCRTLYLRFPCVLTAAVTRSAWRFKFRLPRARH